MIDFNVIKSAAPKFIYDGLYSASIGYFDTLLKRNGIDFESTNLHYDPDFGGGLPEPKEKYMHHKKEGFLIPFVEMSPFAGNININITVIK